MAPPSHLDGFSLVAMTMAMAAPKHENIDGFAPIVQDLLIS
jgi:hypothetical protein